MLPHALNWTINTQVIKFSEFNRGNKYWLLPYKDWVFNFCLSASTRCMAKSVASLIARQDVFLILILIKNQDSHWTDKWLVTSVSTDQIRDMWRPGRTWGRVTRDTWHVTGTCGHTATVMLWHQPRQRWRDNAESGLVIDRGLASISS